MPEALEIAMHVLEDGITLVTLIAVLHAIFNWHEARKKRAAYARMESKINALLEKEGITWTDGQQTAFLTDLMILKKLWPSYSGDISQAASLLTRRVVKMQLNKAWLAGIIAYLFGILAKKYGVTFGDQAADMTADFIITFVIPLVIAFMNRKKEVSTDGNSQSIVTEQPRK